MDPSPPAVHGDSLHQMEFHSPVTENAPASPALWEWGDFLDFNIDDQFPLSFDDDEVIAPPPQAGNSNNVPPLLDQTENPEDRIRKRDPRMTCSNFLAGRVPCACPEIDEQLALEEDAAMPGKKRLRMARSGTNTARCQVPGCEADITQLKGYHRRHKVCLGCANASAVLLDGETKRYCQQCGKFHVLLDFDKGKRSCRRKLEKHNNRRRRKPQDPKKVYGDLVSEDTKCDGEAGNGKDGLMVEKEVLVESEDGHVSAHNSGDPNIQNISSDSAMSFGTSGDTQMDGGKDDSKFSLSPSNCDNKSAYLSMCPTGRISFKLYDWNPAEFPRRLRHQIFQWLASMPVELEGYIRPGCTILTAFISMPSFAWDKLFEDPVSYLHDLLACGKILSRKGPMLVYLNNQVFQVIKDGASVRKVNLKGQTPKLHYVHPVCFEAGKSIELVACGSNLSQPKFRFLVSFAGKYLAYDYCIELPRLLEGDSTLDHQMYKICIPRIEPNLCGPAFIEVENESGLSNFIPAIIGDRQICSEMEIIQKRFDASNSCNGSECEASTLKQMAYSELLVDIAWLLKDPLSENLRPIMTSSQIQRFNCLVKFLLQHELTAILDKILQNLMIIMDKLEVYRVDDGTSEDDVRLLQKYMDRAGDVVRKKHKHESSVLRPEYVYEKDHLCGSRCTRDSSSSEDLEERLDSKMGSTAHSNSVMSSERSPLLNREVVMNMNLIKDRPSKSCSLIVCKKLMKPRSTVFVIALLAVCFGVCAFLLHPQKVSTLAVTIRRCLTDGF